MLRECADVLAHVHIADTFNHKASSGLRYILNPPGSPARVHQHLNIGQGEVPWDDFYRTLHEVGFDGIMTACVFAWEEKADESGRFMRGEMQRYVDKYWGRNEPPRRRHRDGDDRSGPHPPSHAGALRASRSSRSATSTATAPRPRRPTGAEVFDTPEALIASDRVQAVVICSWGPAHEEQLLASIAAGKPVFCEKPLVTSEAAALRVMDAEVAFGRRLVQVGFMRRFDADYRRLKAVIDGGSLGAPLLYHSVHRNASVPEGLYTSDMPLNDTLVHDADIARWLLDDEVTGVEVRVPRRNTPRQGPARPGLRAPAHGLGRAGRRRDLGQHRLRLRHPRRGQLRGRRRRRCRTARPR